MITKEIKEIKDKEELEKFNQYLINNPFSPNRIRYQGLEMIILNGKAIDLASEKVSVVEDYFHPNYWIYINSPYYAVITKVISAKSSVNKSFNLNNPDTYIQVNVSKVISSDHNNYAITSDMDLFISNGKKIISGLQGELKPVSNTEEEMENLGFVKGIINTEYWFHKSELKDIDTMLPYKKFENTFYKVDLKSYEERLLADNISEDEIKRLLVKARKDNIIFGVDSATYKGFEGLRYTFGVEIETCIGRLEPKDYEFLNVKAVHDGSLRDAAGNTPGGEFVTGILTGDAGLTQLAELCRILSFKCKLNEKCGVHIHAGNLNWNKEDICFSYILAEQLEDELFNMLPKSRRANSYCRRLTQLTLKYLPELRETRSKSQYDILIDTIYNDIFKEVTYVKDKPRKTLSISTDSLDSGRDMNRSSQHPNGAKCGYDKNAQRYCWLNFVTLLYNTKGLGGSNTLELRSHSATMNFNKIKNWIKVFFAICRFIENNKTQIKEGKVTLEQVVMEAYPLTGEKLVQYIEERKQLFKSHDESVDYVEISPKKRTIKEIVETA